MLFDCGLLGHAVYTVETLLRWRGAVDLRRAREAFCAAIDRHDALRLRVLDDADDRGPWAQGLWQESAPQWRVSPAIKSEAINPALRPPIEIIVSKSDGDVSEFLIRFHHIAADRTTIELLVEDVVAYYLGEVPAPCGRYEVAVDALRIAYRHNEDVRTPKIAAPWQCLRLPARWPTASHDEVGIERLSSSIDDDLWPAIVQFARASGTTPQYLTLAAYAAALARLGRTDGVTIGVPVSLRDTLEQPRTAGCLMTVLPLAVATNPDVRLVTLAGAVRDALVDLYSQPWTPPLAAAGADGISGRRDGHPLFQTVFAWSESFAVERDGLSVTLEPPHPYPARVLASLLAVADTRRLSLHLDYDPMRLHRAAAAAVVDGVRRLLLAFAAGEDQRLQAIAFGGPPKAAPSAGAPDIIEIIETRMEITPDRTAYIDSEGRHYSYKALRDASGRVANWASAQSAGPAAIGLAVHRSFEMLAGLLGLLRAGRVVALLDPEDPGRIGADADAGCIGTVLTKGQPLGRGLAAVSVAALLKNDSISERITPRFVQATAPTIMLFTSGTTGRPKPVVLTRGAVSVHADWARRCFSLTDEDRVLQFCSVGFDAMLEEVLPALAAGAALVARNDEAAASAQAFFALCESRGITVANLPTGFFNMVLPELAATRSTLPGRIRLVVIGGEAYAGSALTAWSRLADRSSRYPVELITTYGPAEATVVIAASALRNFADSEPPLLGEPRPGCQIYLLDRYGHPCPSGVIGELFVGGDMVLASGYYAEPAATAESFLPDPFAGKPAARMYRTGDLAMRCELGRLRYMGRRDRQVKSRGLRIELGGTEQVLSTAFDGAPCVVIARTEESGVRLVACIQADDGPDARLRLERALAGLPAAARPVSIRFGTLPLTSRGKVDRASLARGAIDVTGLPIPFMPEQELPYLNLVARVLGVATIASDADFFAAGGNSLAVLRLIALARQEVGVALDVSRVFQSRFAGQIAALISGAPRIATAKPEDPWRLNPFEAAVYLDDQLVEGVSPYLIRETWRLNGEINRSRLKRALVAVLARHPILRSEIVLVDGVLRWKLLPRADAFHRILDEVSEPPPGERWHGLSLKIADESAGRQRLEITAHHAVIDGRGLDRFVMELAAAYRADAGGKTFVASLPAWPDASPQLIEDWRKYLEGIGRPPRPEPDLVMTERRSTIAVHAMKTSVLVSDDFETAAGQRGGPFVVIAAAVAGWLHRFIGCADVLIATPVATEVEPEHLRVATTVLPLRSRLSLGATFSDLVQGMGDALDWALDRRLVGLNEVARILREEAGGSGALPVLFDLQDNRDQPVADFNGTLAERLNIEPTTVRADLEISARIDSLNKITFALRGRSSMYSAAAVTAWAESLVRFTEASVEAPTRRIDTMPLVEEGSRWAAVRRGRDVGAVLCIRSTLREAFVQRWNEAVAVSGETVLTGTQAAAIASAVALRLVSAGIGPGAAVYCELPRSIYYPAVLLGIWEIGAVPVLVNPEHPAARRLAMRCQLPAAMTVSWCSGPDRLGIDLAELVAELRDSVEFAVEVPSREPRSRPQVAYIAFTSGSTGIPKPVACSWTGLSNLLHWSSRCVPMDPSNSFLHTGAPGFDISVWEMLHPLLSGARLVVAPSLGEIGSLIELCERYQCSHAHFVPAVLEAFLDAAKSTECKTLSVVLCGGEAMAASLHRRLLERCVSTHHCYGPTEASIFVLSWRGERPSPWRERLPLGDPIDGVEVAVIDPAGLPMVRGAIGELAISGGPLAIGYLGMARETAARFRPSPELGGRMYLTGDRVRMLPDGSIEYRGRADRQMKLSGVRIELDEVERALEAAQGVARAVVSYRRNDNGGGGLIAYVVVVAGADERVVATAALAAARMLLPAAAVPRRFVCVHSIPLGPNGKVDYAALPEPPAPDSSPPLLAATADLEQDTLLLEWQNAIGCGPIGLDDNFFALGGDSMAAIRLVAAARRRGFKLRLAELFHNPTIRLLAAHLRARDNPPTPTAPHGQVVPGTPLQMAPAARRWLAGQSLLNGEGMACLLLRAPMPIEPARLEHAWLGVLRRRDALNLVVRHEAGRAQVFAGAPPATVAIAVATDPAAAMAAARVAIRPRSGVMAGLSLTTATPDILAVAIHHLAADLYSWGLLLEELWAAYNADDGLERLPPPASFAVWSLTRPISEPSSPQILCRRPGAARDIFRCELAGPAAMLLAQTGSRRTALLVAAAGASLGSVFARQVVILDLEVNGRDALEINRRDSAGITNAMDVVGWLTDFRSLRIAPNGDESSAWLTAAEHALTSPPGAYPGEPTSVLSIVPEYPVSTGGFVPLGPADEDLAPTHPTAIEIELGKDRATITIDCDDQIPTGTASALAGAMVGFLERLARDQRCVPLTPLQEAMMVAHLRRPNASLYHTQIVFAIEGDVDLTALRKAWMIATQVHDAFRCRIELSGNKPVLVIDPESTFDWGEQEGCGSVDHLCYLAVRADRTRGFDLACGPLSRWLAVTGSDGIRLIWSHHHLLFDGWSLNLVVQTVARAYSSLRRGHPSSLIPAPSLAHFAAWWAERDVAASVAHWVAALRGLEPAPLDRERSSDGEGGAVRLELAGDVGHALLRLSKAHNATLHEVVLAAWALVMARQTRTRDICFGIVVALRPPELPGIEDTVGLFMNTVPIRLAVAEDIAQLLAHARRVLADALDHSDAPLSQILSQVLKHGGPAGFDSVLVFENYPGDRTGAPLAEDGRLTVRDSYERSDTPFVLVCLPGDPLRFELLYDGDRLSPANRLCLQLERVLQGLATLSEVSP